MICATLFTISIKKKKIPSLSKCTVWKQKKYRNEINKITNGRIKFMQMPDKRTRGVMRRGVRSLLISKRRDQISKKEC